MVFSLRLSSIAGSGLDTAAVVALAEILVEERVPREELDQEEGVVGFIYPIPGTLPSMGGLHRAVTQFPDTWNSMD